MTTPLLTLAEQDYFEFLQQNADELSSRFDASIQKITDVAFPTLPQAHFVPMQLREELQRISLVLNSCFEKAIRAFFESAIDAKLVPISENAYHLALKDYQSQNLLLCARFDSFYDPLSGRIQIMECNAGDPSGDGSTDMFLEALLTLSAFQTLEQKYELQYDFLMVSHYQMLKKILKQKGCKLEELRWAKLTVKEMLIYPDHQAVSHFYRKQGQELALIDPRDFHFEDQDLSHQGQSYDVLLRDTIDELILEPFFPSTNPILEAYEHGHVMIFNPFFSMLADFKGFLEVLSCSDYRHLYTDDEWSTLEQVMLWTRVVRDCRTDFEGKDIELLPLLASEKDRFVLKPNEGYGGFGILIGRECSQKAWSQKLQESLNEPSSYVVQEYIKPSVQKFILRGDDNSLCMEERKVTLSFFVHDGEFGGSFSRVSLDSVINVHQGGGLLPVCFLAEKL